MSLGWESWGMGTEARLGVGVLGRGSSGSLGVDPPVALPGRVWMDT